MYFKKILSVFYLFVLTSATCNIVVIRIRILSKSVVVRIMIFLKYEFLIFIFNFDYNFLYSPRRGEIRELLVI